ncbi:alpha/beta fold hydrolase [Plantactinospora soyae]|uniref:Pimeloyl-ACP methyl ester carboxylesterase n=1 Tax=Plantactinospora soyae TaxID=1544732 RepID=A0A927LZ95_9ACTN|nr:alpha/beta hydrolase [Plantactinospora soyae]MBE1485242.1 pimeloyl-ACP methyl ester carboxylesterase [Plantactinospora soyae]
MYGLDGPALLLMPALWLIVGSRPTRWRCAAALAVNAVFLVEVLGDLAWFLDHDKRWLHVALTMLPAAAVCGWTLPRLIRTRESHWPHQPWLAVPAKGAALCAVLNLYFAVVPHERITPAVLAAPLVPAAAVFLAIVLLSLRDHPRGRLARASLGIGLALALVVALGAAAMTTSTVTGYAANDLAEARTRAVRVPVRTGRVATEGDNLYFEVRGSGPPLLMIGGAQGDAGFYTYPAALLADEYQVITYDRRGHSRSTRNTTSFDIAQQARDALAVLRAAGHDTAIVFGNSAGAIIALELAARYPEAVTAVIAHEPPMIALEPDRKSLAFFAAVGRTSRLFGAEAGMFMFSMPVGLPFAAYGSIPADFSTRTAESQAYFVEQEMQDFVSYRPDLVALKAGKVPIVPAVGVTTQATNRYYGRPAGILAERLDVPLVVFPGHHMSYFDLPRSWTEALRGTLHRTTSVPGR